MKPCSLICDLFAVMLAFLDRPRCYHSLYQQAGSQCISYFSCHYANTWQKHLCQEGKFVAHSSVWHAGEGVAERISSHHMTRSGGKGMPELDGSLLFPFYSMCPTAGCELMPHTHIRVFHSQWIHSGDSSTKDTSKDMTSLLGQGDNES